MVPVYFTLLEWWRPGGSAPSLKVVAGLTVGVIGLILLVGPSNLSGATSSIDLRGVAYVLVGSLAWSVGSIYSKQLNFSDSPAMRIAMQTLSAGIILALISISAGEPQHMNLSSISMRSILSLAYLIVFGSIIGFSAYVYLLHTVRPTLVSTYAYVNPVVAVFLGWALAGEHLNSQMMLAATVILSAVWIITQSSGKPAVAKASQAQQLVANKT
jgi:drug/metabolite transporter (DMT)-like permease